MSRKSTPKGENPDVSGIIGRLKGIVGDEWGAVSRYAEKVGVPQQTLNNYLKGVRVPSVSSLAIIAEKEGLTLDWLITGEGPKYKIPDLKKKRSPKKAPARIPILGRVPAGMPGGQHWSEYEASDLLDNLTGIKDPDLIALEVEGVSMFPFLFPGDFVVMTPHGTWRTGDLIVAEIKGAAESYHVKRLGQEHNGTITLVSDNFLEYEPLTLPREKVDIRGRVVRVVRTPDRKSPFRHGEAYLAEFYRNAVIQDIVEMLPRLDTKMQDVVIAHIRALIEARS